MRQDEDSSFNGQEEMYQINVGILLSLAGVLCTPGFDLPGLLLSRNDSAPIDRWFV